MSTTVIMVIGGLGFFLAMGLMRWTLRQSRRREYDGIRWRGIDWSRVDRPASDAASDADPSSDEGTRQEGDAKGDPGVSP